eukprot:gene52005-65562_t
MGAGSTVVAEATWVTSAEARAFLTNVRGGGGPGVLAARLTGQGSGKC